VTDTEHEQSPSNYSGASEAHVHSYIHRDGISNTFFRNEAAAGV
jgi:hypothetical protein